MTCSLCGISLPKHPLKEEEDAFCCTGCRTVFHVLKSQGVEASFRDHPLFEQAAHAGILTNPALLDELKKEEPEEKRRMHFSIDDLWCPSCAEVIRFFLLKKEGVFRCSVDYATDLAIVEYDPKKIDREDVFHTIEKCGYTPTELLGEEKKRLSTTQWVGFGVAAFCTLNLMMLSYPLYVGSFGMALEGYEGMLGWLSFLCSLPLISFSALPIWKRFWRRLRVGVFGMETLVTVGVFSAWGLSLIHLLQGNTTEIYFDSMGMVIVFVLLGKILERKAKWNVKEKLVALTRSLPKRGRCLLKDGSTTFKLIKEIALGERLVAFTGEKIVLDGTVLEGEGACDEAVMTGESMPVRKRYGSELLGGSLLKSGSLVYSVRAEEKNSTLTKILDLTSLDLDKKKAERSSVDRLTSLLVPGILCLALATFFLTKDPLRMLSVLLISCPCALGIAVPLAEALLISRFAEQGIIVRNRAVLPKLARITGWILDKTGTVTEGVFRLQKGIESLDKREKRLLKALASPSTHPLAVATAEAIPLPPLPLQEVEEVVGKGMRGFENGKEYRLGSAVFVGTKEECEEGITTQVYFSEGEKTLATLTFADRVRSEVKEVVKLLPSPLLLSGDSARATRIVAEAIGCGYWEGECDPLRKREKIHSLQQKGEIVAMVGDGVNDAPALTCADVAISAISATDISVQVSDLLLTSDSLECLPLLTSLARRGERIVRQNLFWAFFYNACALPLAAYGLLRPLYAALAMLASSLLVIFNSQRLLLSGGGPGLSFRKKV